MISMKINHPDIEEFINVKTDLNKATKANMSVRITKDFMEKVIADEDFTATFKVYSSGETISRTWRAKELFDRIVAVNWDYAEPGMLFWDRINEWNIMSEDDEFEFAGVNPCLVGDTQILTDKGYIEIQDAVDKPTRIWNGFEWSDVTPRITGHDQEIYEIEFSNGRSLKCTPYHKFILNDDIRVEAKDLRIGDKLIKHDFPIIEGFNTLEDAYTQGTFSGYGYLIKGRNGAFISLYNGKKHLIESMSIKAKQMLSEEKDVYSINIHALDKLFVPINNYDINSRLEWLAGILDTDGRRQDKDGSISISSIQKEFLLDIQLMLNTMGVHSTVSVIRPEGTKSMPNGKGGYVEYLCQEYYRIIISAFNATRLNKLGLNCRIVDTSASCNRESARFITIKRISKLDEVAAKVYCFTDKLNHSGIFNGVITGQCAEETLPAGGSCLLTSLNMSAFASNKVFDFEGFKRATRIGVEYLNELLHDGIDLHPLKIQRESVEKYRQIGLGIMGLGNMLIKMNLKYSSKEARDLVDKIMRVFANEALLTSSKLTRKYGTFKTYKKHAVLNSPYVKFVADEETLKSIELYGLANSQILTIPPTGSTATFIGESTGCEPNWSFGYTRKTESLHGKDVFYEIVETIVKELGFNSVKDLPDYFESSSDISPRNRVLMQSVLQKYIDAAISSTVNLPNSATKEDIGNIYMDAHLHGLKGITVYRDGCARSGILTSEKPKENDVPSELKLEEKVTGLPLEGC